MFETALFRRPTPAEGAVLDREAARAHAHYLAHPDDAATFLATADPGGMFVVPADGPERAARAAATVVASLILNLDEAVSHE